MDSKQVYEIAFHIVPTVSEEKLGDEVSLIRNIIEEGNGVIISEDFPKMRDLAYNMQKYVDTKKVSYDRAYFGWIKFESEASLAQQLKTAVDAHAQVLRYLIVKTVKENTLLTKPKERQEETEETEHPKKKETTSKKEEKMSEKEIDESIEELVIE